MRRAPFAAVALAALALASATSSFGNAEPDVRRDAIVEAVAKVKPSVVNISTRTLVVVEDPFEQLFSEFFDPYHRRRVSPQFSLGSGVIIDEDGYIITNNHVVQRGVEDPQRSTITVLVGTNEYQARVEGVSATSDIALLKIDRKGNEKFQAIKFAKDDDLLLGETVIALGNPFGLGLSVSRGILSSTTRRPQPEDKGPLNYQDWLQTDAAVNPGNSGGPLVNLRGELIGINNAVFRQNQAQGISFAIPIKLVGETLSEIFTPENKGFWFGARITSNESRLAVTHVQPGSPAEKSGLKQGDIIVKIGDKAPKNFIQFMVELIKRSGSTQVPFTVIRDGQDKTLTASIVKEENVFNAELIRQKTGLTVQAITDDIAQYLQVQPGSGLVITGVDRNSPAANAGLQPGIILTGVDDDAVNDVKVAAKKIYDRHKGEKLVVNVVVIERKGAFLVSSPGRATLNLR